MPVWYAHDVCVCAACAAAGRKILTTCQDNRLRVWDYLYATHQVRTRYKACRGEVRPRHTPKLICAASAPDPPCLTGSDFMFLPHLASPLQPANREIVHSQNFNRYLTAFRAEWDPKDPAERLIVCGRCDG